MEYVETAGPRIPKIGLGTSGNTGENCARIVETALEMGYRHLDTAQMYGNEGAVGDGIAAASVDREELFVTTKVDRPNLRRDDVHESVRASLDRLDLEYVDLLLIHWPHPRVPFAETLEAMEELHEEGLVANIGVSNFTRSQLREAMDLTDVPIVTDQVQYHPYRDQSALRELCVENRIALTAYSPLAKGDVLSDDLLADVGERHGKSAAQVALRWLVQQEGVVAIPKASSRDHLADNLAVFDFSLTDEEVERIDEQTGGLGVRLRNRVPGLVRRLPL